MKLALALDVWDPSRGGLEAYAQSLSRVLCSAGHEIRVVTSSWRAGDTDAIQVERVDARGPRYYAAADLRLRELRDRGYLVLSFRHPASADVFLPLGGLLVSSLAQRRRAEPAWLRGPRALARRLSAKTRQFLGRERAFFESRGHESRLVLANSPLVKADIESHFPRFAGRVEVVGLPVDVARWPLADEAARTRCRARIAAVEDGDSVLLFVGHDTKRKGLEQARRVLARLSQRRIRAKLLIAGRGSERHTGGRVVGLGQVGADEMLELYHGADVLLAPSLEDNLSFCVLEALATGLPVVTTSHNGVSAWIRDPDVGRVVEDALDISALDAATLACLDRGALDASSRRKRREAISECEASTHYQRVLAALAAHAAERE